MGGAVRRNKIKRLIREAYRLTRWEIESRSGGVDVVVIPNRTPERFPLADLMRELPLIVDQAAGRTKRGRRRQRGPRRSGGKRKR